VQIVQSWAKDRHGSACRVPNQICDSRSFDFKTEKLNRILDFDQGNLTVTVQSGARLQDVRAVVEGMGQYLWWGGGQWRP